MALRDVLESGQFVVTAELGPPLEPNPEAVRVKARAFAGLVHAANITDNQAATVKLSPLACSVWMMEEGVEPILQVTTRDRNVMALQADLLGAWALGVRTTLALSGDPLKVGPYESISKPVSELDSLGLSKLVAQMNQGRLAAGEELGTPTDFLIAGAANPLVDTVERLKQKLGAGVRLFQTNIVYDIDRFGDWFAPGPSQPASPSRRAFWSESHHPAPRECSGTCTRNIPGIEVDEITFKRMEGFEGEEAKAVGIDIAVDVVQRLREIPGVAGVHVMAPGWESEAVPRVVSAAGLGQ